MSEPKLETAIFAAGCFWGVEASFRRVAGVIEAEAGYTGGSTANPSYEQVCTGATGHAEAVRLRFDPAQVSYRDLLEAFWSCHDPTTPDRQGPDIGTQYRSAIFTLSPAQAEAAQASKAQAQASGRWSDPIVTQIEAAGDFFRAEDYHQNYQARRRTSLLGRLGLAGGPG